MAAPATGDQAMKLIVPMIALIIVAVVLVVIVIVMANKDKKKKGGKGFKDFDDKDVDLNVSNFIETLPFKTKKQKNDFLYVDRFAKYSCA